MSSSLRTTEDFQSLLGGLNHLLAHAASSNRAAINRGTCGVTVGMSTGTNNATVGTTSVGSAVCSRVDGMGSLSHASTRAIRSVTRGSTPGRAVVSTPTSLAGEGGVVEAVKGGGAGTVDERSVANERDVIDCGYQVSDGTVVVEESNTYSGSPKRKRRSCGRRSRP